MPLTEDVIRLILETRGTDSIKDMRNSLALAEVAARDLTQQWARGEITQEQHTRGANRLGREMRELRLNIEALEAAEQGSIGTTERAAHATEQLGQAAARAAKETGKQSKLGGGLLELSRGLEDLQYGFAGVVNNLPVMISRFGGPAGAAAAISFAAIAVNQLYKHWGDLKRLFDETHVETQAEAMERLEKATERTVEQTAELNRLKKEAADAERAATMPSEVQTIRQQMFSEIQQQTGGPAISPLITAAFARRQQAGTRVVQDPTLGLVWALLPDGEAISAKTEDELKAKVGAHAKEGATRLHGKAATGDLGATKELAGLISQDPFAAATPFGQRFLGAQKRFENPMTKALEKEWDENVKDIEEMEKANEKNAAKVDALNETGRENERKMREDQAKAKEKEGDDESKAFHKMLATSTAKAERDERARQVALERLKPIQPEIEGMIAQATAQGISTQPGSQFARYLEQETQHELIRRGATPGEAKTSAEQALEYGKADINLKIIEQAQIQSEAVGGITNSQAKALNNQSATIAVLNQVIANQRVLAAKEVEHERELAQTQMRAATALNMGRQ